MAAEILKPIYIEHRFNKYPEIKSTLGKMERFFETNRFKELPDDIAFDAFYELHERLLVGYSSSNKEFFNMIDKYLDGHTNVMPETSISNLNIRPILIGQVSPVLIIIVYPLYLIVRFIIWVIKSKGRKNRRLFA